MELQEELVNANVPQHVVDFVMSDERPVKNQEALEEGDEITLVGFSKTIGKAEIRGVERKWVSFDCTGDRCTIGLTALIGTKKLKKHFPEYNQTDATLRLNNDERIAVLEVQKYFGKKLRCVKQKEVELPFTNTNPKTGEEEPATATYNVFEVIG